MDSRTEKSSFFPGDLKKINTKYRQQTTFNGLSFDIAKSALQKFIRRGDYNSAQIIATELDIFRWAPDSKSVITNIFNRLRIIALEDIGLACPQIILDIDALLLKWRHSELVPNSELISVVTWMSQCPHTRLYSHIRSYFLSNPPKKSTYPPSNKFELGKDEGLKVWVDNLIVSIENRHLGAFYWINLILEERMLQQKRPRSRKAGFLIFEIIKNYLKTEEEKKSWELCRRWYTTHNAKESFLYVIHPVYLVILRPELESVWKWPRQKIVPRLDAYALVLAGEVPKMPDYVCDMHTRKGKVMGRTGINFAFEGAYVNYAPDFLKKYSYMEKSYIRHKLNNKVNTEKQEFKLKVRIQVNTSRSRTDVYFATDRLGQNVVVKGPFLKYSEAVVSLRISSVLRLFKRINTYDLNLKILRPDMFMLGETYLGTRTKTNPNRAYYFVISEDLINADTYPVVIKTTKMWNKEPVFDYQIFYENNNEYDMPLPSVMKNKHNLEYLLQLSIRYAFEIGDFSLRNFLRVQDKIYNLDLEGIFVNKNFRIKKSEREALAKVYDEYRSEYTAVLKTWLGPGKSYIDKWIIIAQTLELNETKIDRVKANIKNMIENARVTVLNLCE